MTFESCFLITRGSLRRDAKHVVLSILFKNSVLIHTTQQTNKRQTCKHTINWKERELMIISVSIVLYIGML